MKRSRDSRSIKERLQYYEALGDRFDHFMDDYDVARRHELIFRRLLAGRSLAGGTVLEVGCGTGRFSQPIVEAGGKLTALDIGVSLATNVSKALGSSGVVADAVRLPFADHSFDFVISSECIEHTVDPLQAVAEMCRVCRVGGTVCLTTPNALWYPALWLSHALRIRNFSGIENWVWPRQLTVTLRNRGMHTILMDGCHLWPFQLGFTRPALSAMDRLGRWIYPLMINVGVSGVKTGN